MKTDQQGNSPLKTKDQQLKTKESTENRQLAKAAIFQWAMNSMSNS